MDTNLGFGVDRALLPRHIAIIMDGNGRWAQKRHLPRVMGHRAGMATLKEVVRACSDEGIQVLTVYAFSTENWKRPLEEVNYLMNLLIEYMAKEIEELHQNNVQIRLAGSMEGLPEKVQEAIREALAKTKDNTGLIFNLGMNYGGRAEIVAAVQKVAAEVLGGALKVEDITEDTISNALYTAGLPDPDLLIRTAGDIRISNFLLWQLAYTEMAFVDVAWPEFTKKHLEQIVQSYVRRDRRYGGLTATTEG